MAATEIQLRRIQAKLQQLLKEHQLLQKENQQLKTNLEEAMQQLSRHQEAMDDLKQQVNILKYANGDLSEQEKKEFEKKINTYLKEIDRCIVLLSR